jgi:Cof subfamily protein (haloacid dehalogenase superfamily)
VVKLVVCDIDGTLIDDAGRIPARNLRAFAELRRQNIPYTLATGRMDRMARVYVQQLDVQVPIIACNGAIIRDCATDEVLARQALDPADAAAIVAWMREHGLDFLCYSADDVYYPAGSQRIERFREFNLAMQQTGQQPIQLCPLQQVPTDTFLRSLVKILAVVPDARTLACVRAMLAEKTHCSGLLSGPSFLDIQDTSATKGHALRELTAMLQIPLAQTMVLGDHDNDVAMLEIAGIGVAMAGASQPALAAAHYRARAHHASGVAQALSCLALA